MMLRSLSLKNFRSIGDEGGVGIEIPLGRINYVIGPNGAGKSNVIAALEAIESNLAGGGYEPKPADHFDRDPACEMELGATVELSDEERLRLLSTFAAKPDSVSMEDVFRFSIFQFARYSVVFANGKKQSERISISLRDGSFHTLTEARRNEDMVVVKTEALKMSGQNNEIRTMPDTNNVVQFPGTRELLAYAHPSLSDALKQHFDGLRVLGGYARGTAPIPAR